MATTSELKNKRAELQRQLTDPEILKDGQKVKELSMEYGRIDKEIRGLEKPQLSVGGKRQKTIVEIRAGAGGEEAALFASELAHMYLGYAKKRGWETNPIYSHPTTIGGVKEAIFEVVGEDSYEEMKNEAGVHRVQRIPDTEKIGRIHTSTASVAVLREAEESDIEMRPQDIKIEFFRSSGPGGQNVNKVETAVRIHHLPSDLVVSSQESRSQQKNRERAMTLLRTKLLETQREAEAKKTGAARREQIGSAERAEKIRTYNFPQDRVTDHRVKKSFHNIQSILEGNIEPILEAMLDAKS